MLFNGIISQETTAQFMTCYIVKYSKVYLLRISSKVGCIYFDGSELLLAIRKLGTLFFYLRIPSNPTASWLLFLFRSSLFLSAFVVV